MNQTTTRPLPTLNKEWQFSDAIGRVIKENSISNRPFFIVVLQLKNFKLFRKRRNPAIAQELLVDLFVTVRRLVHPSQHVCHFQDGVGLIFDKVDSGKADIVGQRLLMIAQHVIRSNKHNDLTSRWSDIIYQFLCPAQPLALLPRVGWAVYPRDGSTTAELIQRAIYHTGEER